MHFDSAQSDLPDEAGEEEAYIGSTLEEGTLGDSSVDHMVPAPGLVHSGLTRHTQRTAGADRGTAPCGTFLSKERGWMCDSISI
jgi:hypothetical protein